MLYVIFLILLLITYILIKRPNSLYSIIFSFELFAIILMLLSNIMLTIRQYYIENFIVNDLEYIMYNTLSKIPFSFADIKTLTNVSIIIFFLASVLMIEHDVLYRISKNKWRVYFIVAIIITGSIVLLIFNSPGFIEKLRYIQYSGRNHFADFIKSIIVSISTVMTLTGFIACLKLFAQSRQSKILFKKYQLKLLLIFTLIINIIFILIITIMPIQDMINTFDIYDIQVRPLANVSLFVCVMVLLVMVAFFYHLLFTKKSNILNESIFKKPYPVKQKDILQADNIRHVFHSYKNALFSTKMLVQKAINSYGSSESLETLNEISSNIDDFVKRTGNFLNLYNQVVIEYDYINISDCINTACNKTIIPENIKITKNYTVPNALFYGDYNSVVEVFINLISNASEAIQNKNSDGGEITITTWTEYPWLCISIYDTGTGISRKHRKKIFEPLFSTKQTFNNWGVGLSFVNNIVSTHSGYVNVKSVVGQYSEFQIILPIDDIDEVIDFDKSNDM